MSLDPKISAVLGGAPDEAAGPDKGAGPMVGRAVNRITGPAKVTGRAVFTAEVPQTGLAYGVLVNSTIAKGEVTGLDTKAAEAVPGVVGIMTHRNLPKLGALVPLAAGGGAGTALLPMRDTRIHFAGQPIALVVADTLENATYAASLVRAQYRVEEANTELEKGKKNAKPFGQPQPSGGSAAAEGSPKTPAPYRGRGNAAQALVAAPVKIDATYRIPIEHHNPLEPSGTLAVWQADDRLTVYDTTQWVKGMQQHLALALNVPAENVRVVCRFVGGGFGCKGSHWPHSVLTAAAARLFRRPVKMIHSREQMYTAHGYRAEVEQRYQLGADAQGKLLALQGDIYGITSDTDDWFSRPMLEIPEMLFSCPNVNLAAHMVPLNYPIPTFMRGPGECEATFALSSVLDELAAKLNRDPLEIHLLNYAEKDESKNQPWSSKELRQCYKAGAEKFGWSKRNHTPGSMKDGRRNVGWGMAVGAYPVYLSPAMAKIRLHDDGRVAVQSGVQDLGTEVYTIMAQMTADTLGVPFERINVTIGDTDLPTGPLAAGSRTTASVLPAVQATGRNLMQQFIGRAVADPKSPLTGLKSDQVELRGGRLVSKANPAKSDSYTELLRRNQIPFLEAYDEYLPPGMGATERSQAQTGGAPVVGPDISGHTAYSYGAVFVEVKVDPFIGTLHVTRVVGAYDAGRIINLKTADSQMRGAIVMGIGMACTEETVTDHRLHRFVNNNFADYHVPVQADVPRFDIHFVESKDEIIGPLGAKGVGELGINGVAAAICNAVYHATGRRIRELPITPEKLIGAV